MKDTPVLNKNIDIKFNAHGIKLYHLQSFISVWQMHFMYYKMPWYHNQAILKCQGQSMPWSYDSWIYNYLCNRCISPLMLWVQLPPMARCTTLCDKVSDLRQVDCFLRVLRLPPPIILLKVTLNTIKPTIQTTKNYSINWNGNHQKRDEIDTNSHSLFLYIKY